MINLGLYSFPITVAQDPETSLFTVTYGDEVKAGLDTINAAAAIGGAVLTTLHGEDMIQLPGALPPLDKPEQSGMWAWMLAPWHAYQRRLDIKVLWPVCKSAAHDNLEHARGAFMMHTIYDPAWRHLPDEEVNRIIAELK